MEAPPPVRFLQPIQVKSLLENAGSQSKILVLDVRDEDFVGGHIKGCVNIPSYELSSEKELDAFISSHLSDGIDTIIVHCYLSQQRGPTCARRLANRLSQMERLGMPEVCVMAHGWRRFHQLFSDSALCEYD